MNAEFQRTARRDKKAFLGDQCKEVDENNRMRKTRDLFKRIRDTKGAFHAKISTIKDRNIMDLTKAEDIKKRWQEYTEELYKKIFMTQKTTMVMVYGEMCQIRDFRRFSFRTRDWLDHSGLLCGRIFIITVKRDKENF